MTQILNLNLEQKLLTCCSNRFNPLRAKFFRGNKTYNFLFTFNVIPSHWQDTGSWNPSSGKTRTYLFYIVNGMGADVLAMQGPRASPTMIFTQMIRINYRNMESVRVLYVMFITMFNVIFVFLLAFYVYVKLNLFISVHNTVQSDYTIGPQRHDDKHAIENMLEQVHRVIKNMKRHGW